MWVGGQWPRTESAEQGAKLLTSAECQQHEHAESGVLGHIDPIQFLQGQGHWIFACTKGTERK